MSGLRCLAGLAAVGLLTTCASSAKDPVRLAEPVTVSFDNPLNLIVLDVEIRDQGPFRFALDSGAASTIIDADLAKRLGLETGSGRDRGGTAAGSVVTVAPVTGGLSFRLAPELEIQVDRVITAPFTETAAMIIGDPFDGILGAAVFRAHVVEADYENLELTFHDPAGYTYHGSGTALDLEFPSWMPSLPFIDGTLVNGDHRLSGRPILVDSGGQTMGTTSIASRSEWDAMLTPDSRVLASMGATGLSNDPEGVKHASFITQMDRLILGPFEFEKPTVSYSAGGPDFAVMGATLLHRFTVVFDYARKRLILEPNALFDRPPVVDQSGVLLVSSRTSDRLEVMHVSDQTPGQRAGLARGDVILAVDGVPSAEIPLNDARRLFSRTCSYRLDVMRESRKFETTLETRPLFGD